MSVSRSESLVISEVDLATAAVGDAWMKFVKAGLDEEALERRLEHLKCDKRNTYAAFSAARDRLLALLREGRIDDAKKPMSHAPAKSEAETPGAES